MEFRLFPFPSGTLITPFFKHEDSGRFTRYFHKVGSDQPREINVSLSHGEIVIDGPESEIRIIQKPNRRQILSYLSRHDFCSEFNHYVRRTVVVPTFPMSQEEALIKTIIRQVIRAKQARTLFSRFACSFGCRVAGAFCFPCRKRLLNISVEQLRMIGLGMKAERIHRALPLLPQEGLSDFSMLGGIGNWSNQVMRVETLCDYSNYPFWDMSGFAIEQKLGLHLQDIVRTEPILAAGLYVYAASFLESRL